MEGLSKAYHKMVRNGFEPIVQDALEEFDKNGNRCYVNLGQVFFIAVGEFGSKEQVDNLRKPQDKAEYSDEKYRIGYTLSFAMKKKL